MANRKVCPLAQQFLVNLEWDKVGTYPSYQGPLEHACGFSFRFLECWDGKLFGVVRSWDDKECFVQERYHALQSQLKTSKPSIMFLAKLGKQSRKGLESDVSKCRNVKLVETDPKTLWRLPFPILFAVGRSCSFGIDSLRKSKRPWISVSATRACSTSLSCEWQELGN